MYGGCDPRAYPAYRIADVARYLRIGAPVVRDWVQERAIGPVVVPADSRGLWLSFNNLVEAHVLRALYASSTIGTPHVARAIRVVEHELGITRLLLREELQAAAAGLLLDYLGRSARLSRPEILVVGRRLSAHLGRVERDGRALPVRFYPFGEDSSQPDDWTVVIDPRVSFGRPTVNGSGIQTSVLVQRIEVGESVTSLAEDYGLSEGQVDAAVRFEQIA